MESSVKEVIPEVEKSNEEDEEEEFFSGEESMSIKKVAEEEKEDTPSFGENSDKEKRLHLFISNDFGISMSIDQNEAISPFETHYT